MKCIIRYSLLLSIPVLLVACNDAGYQTSDPKAFFNESVSSNQYAATTIEIGENGTDVELTAALSNSLSEDAVFDLVADPAIIDAYNAQRSTAYALLASEYWSGDNTVTIPAGSYSVPVKIHVDPLPQEVSSKDVAIPLRLSGTGNVQATTVSATHLICIESVDTVKVIPLFNGAAELSNSSLNIAGTGQFTIEVSFQLDRFNNRNMAVFSHANMLFRFEDPQNPDSTYPNAHSLLQFQGTGSTAGYMNPTTAFELDRWQHYAVTWDGTEVSIYVNGSKDKTTGSGITSIPDTSFPSASWFTNGDGNWWGSTQLLIREARIWTVARTASQIANDRNSVSATTNGLAAYWTFDEDTYDAGTRTFEDVTGNGHALTCSGSIGKWVSVNDSATETDWDAPDASAGE